MQEAEFSVAKQKIACAPAHLDSRSRDRKTLDKEPKKATRNFQIGHAQASRILRMHPDVYEWTKDSSGCRFLQCRCCLDVVDHIDKATPKKIQRHVESPSHKEAVVVWQEQEARKAAIFKALKADATSPRTKNDDENVFRCATVSAFLSAGIPLNKIAALRPFLEHYCNAKLDDVDNLKKIYLPRLRRARINEIKEAIRAGAQISIIHDGTNRHSEFYCVVVRWCDSAFNVEERLISLKAYRGAQKGQELALMLTEILNSLDLSMGEVRDDGSYVAGRLLAITRDRASVNL